MWCHFAYIRTRRERNGEETAVLLTHKDDKVYTY